MFAKLKKKIENESGASLNSESPGKTTQHRRDSVSSLPRAGSYQHLGPSPPGSITSEDSSMRDVSNPRDELAVLLQRKTEQCKKLEGNISDLAALIKDKSKTIDKLEQVIKQHDDVTNKKLQEQKEEFERYRDKLIEGYQNDKLKLEKLLNTEEALASCRSELETKSRQCHAAETQVEKLTDELGPLKQRLSVLEADNHKLKEENNERAELVISLSKDKSAFDKRLDEMNREMTEKLSQISKLQEQLSDLDGEYKTLIRNSDLHRNKTSKLLEEKDDQIDTLQERVKLLEQRLSDSGLSGDERTSALNAERDSMEQKLAEARQQLTEVKSTWSDKISHLEQQISHLNAKIVEDSEELTNNQNITEQMRVSFHKQIEDLREKLADAENRALENLELASSKATHYEKQIEELESEMRRMKLAHEDKETQHKANILFLESQLSELQAKNQQDQDAAFLKNSQLEERLTDLLNRETGLQEQVTDLTGQIHQLNSVLSEKDEEISKLRQQIIDSKMAADDQNKTISSLNEQLSQKVKELELAEKVREDIERHWQATETGL